MAGPSPSPSPSATPNPDWPTLKFRSASYVVGENGGVVWLTIDKINQTSDPVYVDYSTSDDTAKSGVNYESPSPNPSTLMIPAGDSSATIMLNILDDNIYMAGGALKFNVTLSSPKSANLDPALYQTTVSVIDQDPAPIIRLAPEYYSDERGGTANITVYRENDAYFPVSAVIQTNPGTARPYEDYTPLTRTVTFAKGEMNKTVSISVWDDGKYSLHDEYFYVNLSNPTGGATLVHPYDGGTVFLKEEDHNPVIAFNSTATYVNETDGMAIITVMKTYDSTDPFSAHWYTADGSGPDGAKAGQNYNAMNGTITFYPYDPQYKQISVPLINDHNYSTSPKTRFGIFLSPPLTGNADIGINMSTMVIINQMDPAPMLEFNMSTITVNENTSSVAINVTRTNDALSPVFVDYATHDVTAKTPVDYSDTHGTLTFSQGVMNQTIIVPIHNDNAWSPSKTLTIGLSNPSGGAVIGGMSSATITINEVDAAPVVQFNATAYRVKENAGIVYINATSSIPVGLPLSINYTTGDGNATPGVDYGTEGDNTPVTGTITIMPYQSYGLADINIIKDGSYRGDRWFNVTLAPPAGISCGVNRNATVTIVDTDPRPTVQFTAANYYVNETDSTVNVTVNRTGSVLTDFSVNYTMINGTARSGIDFDATPGQGTLHFTPGNLSQNLSINIINDLKYGRNKSFSIALDNITNLAAYGTPAVATVTIIEKDPVPVLEFDASSYYCNESDSFVQLNVTRVNDSDINATVDYQTFNGSATSPLDYNATNGTLTFVEGNVSNSIKIPIHSDGYYGSQKNFTVRLSNPVDARLGLVNNTTVFINESDPAPAFRFNASSYVVMENGGSVTINVTRDVDAAGTMNVSYNTSDGTAHAGTDYMAANGMLNFSQGVLSRTFQVPIMSDNAFGLDKNFYINLSGQTGNATLGTPNNTTVTIKETDGSIFSIGLPAYQVDDTNDRVDIVVNRLNDLTTDVTVQFNTSDGTAHAGVNYTSTNETLTFSHGEMSRTISIPIIIGKMGSNVTFNVTLSDPSSGSLLGVPDNATVTITNSTYQFTYNLVPGWNLISVPLDVTNTSIQGFFPAEVLNNTEDIWGWNETAQNWMFYGPDPNDYFYAHYPALTGIETGHAYWVEMYATANFTIVGRAPASAPGISAKLVSPWNFRGVTGMTGQAPASMYPQAEDVWAWNETAQNWMFYGPDPNDYFYAHYPALTTLKPGYGYWVEIP